MTNRLALQLDEMEQMEAPLSWWHVAAGALGGFAIGIGVGIALT